MKKIITILFLAFAFIQNSQAIEIAFEQDSSLPIVYINIAVKTGSVSDPTGQGGLTNFLGEMLLRGTKERSKEQIDLALDQMGANLAIDVRTEALIVRGSVLSSQLDNFLKLLNELLTQPSFPENEIVKLKSEIVSGILEELGEDPSLAARRFNKYLFRDHPYGKPVLGNVKDINSLTRDEIVSQYEKLFKDPLLLVVGTGDAEEGRISDWAKTLGNLRAGTTPIDPSKTPIPENAAKRRLLIVDKPDRTQTQVYMGQIGVRMTDKNFFPLYLGNYAFGGPSFSARLMVEIRVKRGWSYGANSSFRHGLKPRSWIAHLFPAEKDTVAATAYTLGLIDDLQKNGITQSEYDFSKQSLVNSAGFMYNTPKKRVENKLLERTLDLPDGYMKSYGPEISKVKLEDVNSAMKNFLKPDQLAITVLGTASHLKEGLAKAAGVSPNEVDVWPYTQE